MAGSCVAGARAVRSWAGSGCAAGPWTSGSGSGMVWTGAGPAGAAGGTGAAAAGPAHGWGAAGGCHWFGFRGACGIATGALAPCTGAPWGLMTWALALGACAGACAGNPWAGLLAAPAIGEETCCTGGRSSGAKLYGPWIPPVVMGLRPALTSNTRVLAAVSCQPLEPAVLVPGVGNHHHERPGDAEQTQGRKDPQGGFEPLEDHHEHRCGHGQEEACPGDEAPQEHGSAARGVAVLVRAADAHEPVADGVAGAAFDSELHQHVDHGDANGDAAQQHQHPGVVNDEAAALGAGDRGEPDGQHHHQQRGRPHPVEHGGAQAFAGRRGNQVQLATHSRTSPLYVGAWTSARAWLTSSVGRLPEGARPASALLCYRDTTGNRAAMRSGPLHQLPLRVVDVPDVAGGPVGQRGTAGRAERRSGTYQLLAALAALGVVHHGSLRFSLKSRRSTVCSSSVPDGPCPTVAGPTVPDRHPPYPRGPFSPAGQAGVPSA